MARGVVATTVICTLLCCTFLQVEAVFPPKWASMGFNSLFRRAVPTDGTLTSFLEEEVELPCFLPCCSMAEAVVKTNIGRSCRRCEVKELTDPHEGIGTFDRHVVFQDNSELYYYKGPNKESVQADSVKFCPGKTPPDENANANANAKNANTPKTKKAIEREQIDRPELVFTCGDCCNPKQNCNDKITLPCKGMDKGWCRKHCSLTGDQRFHTERCVAKRQSKSKKPVLKPIDCVMSDWGQFSQCNVLCGGGMQEHWRSVEQSARNGGKPCGELWESQECNTHGCAEDCTFSNWSEWSECSQTCGGGGTRTHTRTIEKKAQNGGMCGSLRESEICNSQPCPIPCRVSSWTDWGECSAKCGDGTQTRTTSILRQASNGGDPCPELEESQACNNGDCPKDCEVGDWGNWSTCDATCGGGIQSRSRPITTPQTNGGKECENTEETQECNIEKCEKDCVFGKWEDWSTCSQACGRGLSHRKRVIEEEETDGGACEGNVAESKNCKIKNCPIACEVSDFGTWSPCDASCGGGTSSKTRTVKTEPKYGGAQCPKLQETKKCNQQACPIDCVLSDFGGFGECSAECGGGRQSRVRRVIQNEENGGKACKNLEDFQDCNQQACVKDCELDDWHPWSTCSRSCGTGTKTHKRDVLEAASNGGTCGVLEESEDCNTQPCPVDCRMSTWSNWGPCTASCGGGLKRKTRTVLKRPQNGGAACGNTEDTQTCNSQGCPVNCMVTDFGKFGDCSATCDGGIKSRTRTIKQNSENGGAACPDLTETSSCNTNPCSKNCSLSSWTTWGDCSATCDGGMKKRTRRVLKKEVGEGTCGILEEEAKCGETPCPVDCQMTKWSKWGTCSKTCGGGAHTRTRTVEVEGSNGGKVCEATEETQECNADACPIDCIVEVASEWTKCSRACGGGQQSQMWIIVKEAENGGSECPRNLVRARACNEQACTGDEQVQRHAEEEPNTTPAGTSAEKPDCLKCVGDSKFWCKDGEGYCVTGNNAVARKECKNDATLIKVAAGCSAQASTAEPGSAVKSTGGDLEEEITHTLEPGKGNPGKLNPGKGSKYAKKTPSKAK